MSAAVDSHKQAVVVGKADAQDDFFGVQTTRNQRGSAIDHAVPYLAMLVVIGIFRLQHLSIQL